VPAFDGGLGGVDGVAAGCVDVEAVEAHFCNRFSGDGALRDMFSLLTMGLR
jgi:hypothetical protein